MALVVGVVKWRKSDDVFGLSSLHQLRCVVKECREHLKSVCSDTEIFRIRSIVEWIRAPRHVANRVGAIIDDSRRSHVMIIGNPHDSSRLGSCTSDDCRLFQHEDGFLLSGGTPRSRATRGSSADDHHIDGLVSFVR